MFFTKQMNFGNRLDQWCVLAVVSWICFAPVTAFSQGAPSIKSGGIVTASAFGQFPVATPGVWIEVYGSNLASTARSWAASDFTGLQAPISLDGVGVTFDGVPGYVSYISPGQINVQFPDVGVATRQVVVTTRSGSSFPYTLKFDYFGAAGLLAPAAFKVGGVQYAAALFADGTTYALPPNAIAGVPSRRAKPGDTLTFYGIGFGAVAALIPPGQIVQQSSTLVSDLKVKFGSTLADVTYAGLAPNAIGLYQFNVTVPNVASSDSTPVTFVQNAVNVAQPTFVAVQNGNPPSTGITFSKLVVSATFQPQGATSLTAGWVVAPENGLTTYSAAGAPGFVHCAASNGNLTYTCTEVAPFTSIFIGGAVWLVNSASLTFSITPGPAPAPFNGFAAGNMTLSGAQPGGRQATFSGPITGNYLATP